MQAPFLRQHTVNRVGRLLVQTRERYPAEPAVVELVEQHRDARAALAAS